MAKSWRQGRRTRAWIVDSVAGCKAPAHALAARSMALGKGGEVDVFDLGRARALKVFKAPGCGVFTDRFVDR